MKISTISQHASIDGAETTEYETRTYSRLVDVQNRLRSLEWQNPDIRYEIEVVLWENQRPETKLDIKSFGELPRKIEFVFREDITKPNNKTRIEVGPIEWDADKTAQMVANMTEQSFDHHKDHSQENAK